MKNIRQSFSVKVCLWVLFFSIPLFLTSVGVLFWQSHKMIRNEAVQRASGGLVNAMHRINRYLITAETATNSYVWLVEQSFRADSLLSFTNRITNTNPYLDGCAISTEPGAIPGYPDGFMAVSLNDKGTIKTFIENDHVYFKERWYSIPRNQQKSVWVVSNEKKSQLDIDDEVMIASYPRPLFNENKKFVGIISTWLSLRHISRLLAEMRPYPHSYYMMLDEKGRYVGHPDSTRLSGKTIFSVADPQRESDLIALGYEMTKGKKGNMSVVINNTPSLVCYMPVEGTPWSLAIVCPDSDIMKGLNRLTYIVLALIIMGMILIFVYCYKDVTISLQPLKLLLEKVQAVTDGKIDVDITYTKRTDIIGVLQNNFVTMLESLNYYINSVRNATAQTQRYNRELEQTTKLAMEAEQQKIVFIQNVSHQIRTPLNIIMGFSQVLNVSTDAASLSDAVETEEIKSIASTIRHNSHLLLRMVMMLFDCSEVGQTEIDKIDKRESVVCNDVCRRAIHFIIKQYPEVPIGFESGVDDNFMLHTNGRYLEFTIDELLNNAVRYSDKQHVSLQVKQRDQKVCFIVTDTGKGIPEAERDKIFKFFTKVDDFSEGLGLGLPLSMRHAKSLGGNLTLDDSYHAGCRFVLELPIG